MHHFSDQIAVAGYRCGWSEDDNKRVIPTIPGPRREPQPKGGQS